GLGALKVPQLAAMAKGATAHAAVIIPANARPADTAGGPKAAEHAVSDGRSFDLRAGRDDPADELVPDREPPLDRDAPVRGVEARAADPARLDLYERVIGTLDLGLGDLFNPHLTGALECDRAHLRVDPTRCRCGAAARPRRRGTPVAGPGARR